MKRRSASIRGAATGPARAQGKVLAGACEPIIRRAAGASGRRNRLNQSSAKPRCRHSAPTRAWPTAQAMASSRLWVPSCGGGEGRAGRQAALRQRHGRQAGAMQQHHGVDRTCCRASIRAGSYARCEGRQLWGARTWARKPMCAAADSQHAPVSLSVFLSTGRLASEREITMSVAALVLRVGVERDAPRWDTTLGPAAWPPETALHAPVQVILCMQHPRT